MAIRIQVIVTPEQKAGLVAGAAIEKAMGKDWRKWLSDEIMRLANG